jgi:glycosyltransferase involved in cell wall biosynthesis
MTDFSILMPVFNELATVETAIARTLEADYPVDEVELVICDDGSTDGTRQLLRDAELPANVTVVEHTRNQGKGAALVTALAHSKGRYVGIMDADLEYDPADMGPLLNPLLAGQAEAVFGTRGFQSHSAYGFWYVVGNKGVTLAANVLYNSWVSDIMTCHKVMQADLMRSLRLREPGFAVEPEITARLLRSGARIYEVPVSYNARSREQGKKLTTIDGFRVLRTLLRCRFD